MNLNARQYNGPAVGAPASPTANVRLPAILVQREPSRAPGRDTDNLEDINEQLRLRRHYGAA